MATEVLRPQDLFVEKFRVPTTSFHRRRTLPATGRLAVKRKQRGRLNAAAAEAKKSSHGGDRLRKGEKAGGGLVMGQVTLLRRGESLSSLASKIPKSPESQKIVRKKIRLVAAPPADIYAGTAFISSPSPRSLPLPSFFNRKDDTNSYEDGATMFLRRVLRLE